MISTTYKVYTVVHVNNSYTASNIFSIFADPFTVDGHNELQTAVDNYYNSSAEPNPLVVILNYILLK